LIGQIPIAANGKKRRYTKVLRELHVGGDHTEHDAAVCEVDGQESAN
jgi:hypothetical protein